MKDKKGMLSPEDFPRMEKRKFPTMKEPPAKPKFPKPGEGYEFPEMRKREIPKVGEGYEFPEMSKYRKFNEERKGYKK